MHIWTKKVMDDVELWPHFSIPKNMARKLTCGPPIDGVSSGGGSEIDGSSRLRLLEAATDDRAQHWWGELWRRSRVTSGCSSGWWWRRAKEI